MTIRVELAKPYAIRAFEAAIASLKRSKNASNTNPQFLPIIDQDIAAYQNAINTITDLPPEKIK